MRVRGRHNQQSSVLTGAYGRSVKPSLSSFYSHALCAPLCLPLACLDYLVASAPYFFFLAHPFRRIGIDSSARESQDHESLAVTAFPLLIIIRILPLALLAREKERKVFKEREIARALACLWLFGRFKRGSFQCLRNSPVLPKMRLPYRRKPHGDHIKASCELERGSSISWKRQAAIAQELVTPNGQRSIQGWHPLNWVY